MSQFNSISQARIPTRSQFNKVNYSLLSQQATTRVSRGCHAALIIGCVTVTAVTAQLALHVGNKRTNQCQAFNTQVLQHVTLVNLQGVQTQECLIWDHSFNLSSFLFLSFLISFLLSSTQQGTLRSLLLTNIIRVTNQEKLYG